MENLSPPPSSCSPIDHDLLLAQSSWVEALARTLVRDPFGAEDVYQETMLAALQAPPRNASDARRLRAWLGRVVYNLSNLSLRRNGRRRAREEDAAKSVVLDSTADQVAKVAVLHEVTASVQELEEPYRSAVLKRYFEGKSTTEIARETCTTDNAVRKRLWRARAKLRGTLDRCHNGDRLAWFGALAPLAGIEIPAAATSAATTATSASTAHAAGWTSALKSLAASPLVWVSAALGIALAAAAIRPATVEAGAGRELAVAAIEQSAAPRGVTTTLRARRPVGAAGILAPEREVVLPPEKEEIVHDVIEEQAPEGVLPELTPIRVRGLVIDLAGQPLTGMRIGFEDADDELGWSGVDGTFEVELTALNRTLVATSDEYAPLRKSHVVEENAHAEHVLVAGRTVDVAGLVIDESGTPLVGATLEVATTEALYRQVPVPLHLSSPVERSIASDEGGGFELAGAIAADGVFLRASHAGFEPVERAMPRESTAHLVMTLRRSATVVALLEGTVLHESGEPATEARVTLGDHETWTDDDGHFALSSRNVSPDDDLFAFKKGYLPARIPMIGAHFHEGTLPPLQLGMKLILGGPALEIAGELRSEDGTPLSGWVVTATRAADDDVIPTEPGDDTAGGDWANTSLPGGESGDEMALTSNPGGGFRIPGLAGGEYVVHAYDPETLLSLHSAPLGAGSEGVELCLADNAWRDRLEGRVLRDDGLPLADARVRVALRVESGSERWVEHGLTALTDQHGCFYLPEVPRHGISLEIGHPEALGRLVDVDPDAPDHGHEFGLPAFTYGRIVLGSGPGTPDRFVLLDAAGNALPLDGLHANRRHGNLWDGLSLVHRVNASARTLVLYCDGEEVRRLDFQPRPGRIVLVYEPPPSSGDSSANGSL